jgi:hypothetical protein
MNYYPKGAQSTNGEHPAATAQVAQNGTTTWEGNIVVGTFPDRDKFVSKITDHNGPVYSRKGTGANDYHPFTCMQDSYRVLYRDGDKTCNAVYYCQHFSQ